MHALNKDVKQFFATLGFGGAGVFATIELQGAVAILAGLTTILALAPIAISRWKKLFSGKDPESLGSPPDRKGD